MMKNLILFVLVAFTACTNNRLPKVEVKTEYGSIIVEIDTLKAPVTAKNFLQLIKQGAYDRGVFYRVVRQDNQPRNNVKIEVVQGGLQADSIVEKYPTIRHETTQETGLKHMDGTISMARSEPGSASTEIFICVDNQPELDYGGKRNPDGQGFAAFGRVVEGMAIVRQIQQGKDKDQYLDKPLSFSIQLLNSPR